MALVDLGVFECEYIIPCDADMTCFYKFDTAVAKQNVLAQAVVIDTVETQQVFV